MKWTENTPPKEGVSYYDHCKLNTPLGLFIIEWKGWKVNPDYDIELDGKWIEVCYTLQDAKDKVKNYLTEINQKLNEFLK